MKNENEKLNVILLGYNYYGRMAVSQRMYNLFSPLVGTGRITLRNIVNFQDKSLITDNKANVAYPKSKNRVLNYLSYVLLSIKMVREWYVEDTINVIYTGYPSLDRYLILRCAHKMGYKIVFDIMEDLNVYTSKNASMLNRLNTWTARKFATHIGEIGDMCFGISDTLVKLCKKWTKEQIPVNLLPVSVDVKNVCSYKKETNENNEIAVFYGGSFGQKDGISYLIDGFTKAWQQDKRLRLYLTGKIAKESAGELELFIMQSEAKEAITYLGCLPTEAYYERMANSDILCMLRVNSVFANSGFPFKLGEYLASGKAVIATRTSDIEKYLMHKQNAYLIHPEDSTLIAEAILALASDDTLRRKIGIAGQEIARKNFDAPKVSEYLYNKIIDVC